MNPADLLNEWVRVQVAIRNKSGWIRRWSSRVSKTSLAATACSLARKRSLIDIRTLKQRRREIEQELGWRPSWLAYMRGDYASFLT